MPRTKEQFEKMREVSNQKIKSAAIKLFAEKGFASTNTQEIVDSAGISMGLMYRHYKSKEELFQSLIDDAAGGLQDMIQAFRSDSEPKAIMTAVVHEICAEMADDNPYYLNLVMLITQSLVMKNVLVSDKIVDTISETIRAAADLIRRGQESGEFASGDPYEMSLQFYASIQGLSLCKFVLSDTFKMPSPEMLTTFLYKEREI
jgi:TetR/AcrR family acrAB operon transcriptional repressor